MIQEPIGGTSAVMVAAIGSVTSVLLALIAGTVTIWNNKIARRAESTANRTEHTVNSKTTALETKIEFLQNQLIAAGLLAASKDATIAAQGSASGALTSAPLPVKVVGTEQPIDIIDKTPGRNP